MIPSTSAAVLLLLPWLGLGAQAASSPTTAPAAMAAPLGPALATITTDTGDFTPGRQDFRRYTDPWWCLAAAQHTRDMLQVPLAVQAAHDTLQRTPARDTLPREVAIVAQACAARFPVAQTAGRDLAALFQLALFARNDTLAQTVVAQRLATAPTDSARQVVLQETLEWDLDAEPARVAAAEAVVARIDALGPAALLAQLQAHWTLLMFWAKTFSAPQMRREAEQVMELGQRLSASQWDHDGEYYVSRAIHEEMAAAYVAAPESLTTLAHRVQQFVQQPAIQALIRRTGDGQYSLLPLATSSIDAVIANLLDGWRRPGETAMPLHADFWFPGPGQETVPPVLGTVSLVVSLPSYCLSVDGVLHAWCGPLLGDLQRWATQYRSAKLAITVVIRVGGATLGSGPEPPTVLARQIQRYVQTDLQLPVNVAVDTLSIRLRLPMPDGRLFRGPPPQPWPAPNYDDYLALIDATGHVRYDHSTTPSGREWAEVDRPFLDALLAQLLPSPTPHVPSRAATVSPSFSLPNHS